MICLDEKSTLCLDRKIHPKRSAEGVILAGVCAVIVWRRRGRAGRLAALAAPPLMRRGRRGAPRGGGGRGGTRARAGWASLRLRDLAALRDAPPPRIRAPTSRPFATLRPRKATLRPPRPHRSPPLSAPAAFSAPRRPRRSRTEGRRAQRAAPPSPAAFTFVSAAFPLLFS